MRVDIPHLAWHYMNPSKEDEEVDTVDLYDLSHYFGDGGDDDIVTAIVHGVDHDVPLAVRETASASALE
jgi:hypothetical protein